MTNRFQELTSKAITAHKNLRVLEATIDQDIEDGNTDEALVMLPIFEACTKEYDATWARIIPV